MLKTPGQILYEHKSPPMLRVVLADGARFATAADVFMVPNESHTPWRFLTQRCKDGWEKTAVGHHIFSGPADGTR